MLKKFYLDKEIPGSDPNEEIVEYPDDIDNETIEKDFTEWVFNQLDSAIIDIEKESEAE